MLTMADTEELAIAIARVEEQVKGARGDIKGARDDHKDLLKQMADNKQETDKRIRRLEIVSAARTGATALAGFILTILGIDRLVEWFRH